MPSAPVYRPTSLNFINQPNPIEPQSIPEKHPLNGTPQLQQAPQRDASRFPYEGLPGAIDDRSCKRRRSGDGQVLDLPKLPVRQSAKRLRIPPTLSGLHQPPPNAGLLPSITTDQPPRAPNQTLLASQSHCEESTVQPASAVAAAEALTGASSKPARKRKKWTDAETASLLKGVARHGIGNWTKILQSPEYSFQGRTALDLKDRFRVCCPDGSRSATKTTSPKRSSKTDGGTGRPSRSDRKSHAELQELGICLPFSKSDRRSRHAYSRDEDDALLRGFEKYGTQWAAIRSDGELHLSGRTATDLRDRMRTRYPERYAKAGLAPRQDPQSKTTVNSTEDHAEGRATVADSAALPAATPAGPPAPSQKPIEPPRPPALPPLPSLEDDVFFGGTFREDDEVQAPITLDREILSYLPSKPMPKLPSLAHVTTQSDFEADQLELPSLMLEPGDGRVGGHFLGFDELLS